MMRSHTQRVEAGVLIVGESKGRRWLGEWIKSNLPQEVAVVRGADEAVSFLKPLLNAAELVRAKQFLANV
jgi:hypothetical protein